MATLLVLAGAPGPVLGQVGSPTVTNTPESVVGAFFEAVGDLDWEAAAGAVHPETHGLFRFHVTSMLDADADGDFASAFGVDSAHIRSWTAERLFAELMEAVYESIPGLLQIVATNAYQILGHVPEGSDLAHVVARVTPYTDGSAPTNITTVTVRRSGARWLVLDSPELDAVSTAMRGLALRPGDGAPGPFD